MCHGGNGQEAMLVRNPIKTKLKKRGGSVLQSMIWNFWSLRDNCSGRGDERARSKAKIGPGGNES